MFHLHQCYICVCLLITIVSSNSQYVSGGFSVNGDQYTLRWDVVGQFVTFRAIAKGTGYVGLGLSPGGTMVDADVFVAGMYENGTVYGIDGHGAAEKKDAIDNYKLLYVRQNAMYTEVHFSRALNTGDCSEDIKIMNEPQYMIWSIGPSNDALDHHGTENRGSVLVNLLNPPIFHFHYSTNKTEESSECVEMGRGMGSDPIKQ